VRDQYRWTDDGYRSARDEATVPLHFRQGRRARLQLAAEKGLLPSICPLRTLQTAAGQCSPTVSEEKVSLHLFFLPFNKINVRNGSLVVINFVNAPATGE